MAAFFFKLKNVTPDRHDAAVPGLPLFDHVPHSASTIDAASTMHVPERDEAKRGHTVAVALFWKT